jgi:predicted RNA-binding protein with PUA-like domain
MPKKYWLMKTEPNVFSIKDLQKSPKKTTCWDGVRNYQARNFMRDQMQVGDRVLFYHSNIDPSIVGTATVVKTGYPDHTALDKKSKYYDAKSTADNPIWFMVDIQFESELPRPLPLAELRTVSGLKQMKLLKKGMRLSVQPVMPDEFRAVIALSKKKPRA